MQHTIAIITQTNENMIEHTIELCGIDTWQSHIQSNCMNLRTPERFQLLNF